MNDRICLGILGGFGALPTAYLYSQLSSVLDPRPEMIVLSPTISKESERMLLRHEVNSETIDMISEALHRLREMCLDLIVVPSVTVNSLIRECGLGASDLPDWLGAINKATEAVSPGRVGVIATNAVIEHSGLMENLRGKGMNPVSAPHLQDSFHEWVLACDALDATNAPSKELLEKYQVFFQKESVDLCLLACTEACLFETSFQDLCPSLANALTILSRLIISRLQKRANKSPNAYE